jgi:hypothetical protein
MHQKPSALTHSALDRSANRFPANRFPPNGFPANRHQRLFRFACRLLQYFLLAIFGFTLFCVLSSVFGAFHVAVTLISAWGVWIGRLGMVVFGVMAAAVVNESLSH